MILTIILFVDSSYLLLETVCFTVLILTEYFMNISELHRIHILTLACIIASIICYALCVILLHDTLAV